MYITLQLNNTFYKMFETLEIKL